MYLLIWFYSLFVQGFGLGFLKVFTVHIAIDVSWKWRLGDSRSYSRWNCDVCIASYMESDIPDVSWPMNIFLVLAGTKRTNEKLKWCHLTVIYAGKTNTDDLKYVLLQRHITTYNQCCHWLLNSALVLSHTVV